MQMLYLHILAMHNKVLMLVLYSLFLHGLLWYLSCCAVPAHFVRYRSLSMFFFYHWQENNEITHLISITIFFLYLTYQVFYFSIPPYNQYCSFWLCDCAQFLFISLTEMHGESRRDFLSDAFTVCTELPVTKTTQFCMMSYYGLKTY